MPKQAERMSDDAVQAKTGKDWDQWFKVLDRAKANEMNHTQIAAYLHEKCDCPGWWSQMVAVTYEQARGLREKNQACTGDFQVSSSKTIPVSLDDLFNAWRDDKLRRRWLKEPALVIRKATLNKSMRITWPDETSVEVNFYTKGDAKSQVALQHKKLADAKAVEKMRVYWAEAMDRLNALLAA